MSTPSPTSPPSPSAPPPSNATSPPPSSPPTNSTSPPPAPPPTSTPSSPPPSTPSAPPPSTPSAPPPSTPSSPPPSTPSAPPPSIPSSPPPSTPSNPSAPPQSTPSIPSPSRPSTPSTPPPPHSVPSTPNSPSVPSPPNSTTPSAPSPPAPHKGSPPSASQGNSKVSISAGAVVGIAIGAAAILVFLCFLFACCRKRKRRTQSPPFDHYGGPPPMPPRKDDYGTQPQQWQHNAPPQPADNIMKLPPQPPAPPIYSSRPPQYLPPPPPPPNFSSGSGSGSYTSGSEPLPPLNPKYTPGYVKSTFTYEELAMATNEFSDYNLLGQGGFGYVHKGVLPNGKEVAIKQLKAGSGQGEREFQAEVEIISRVHHRHLVSLVGYCISGDHRLLVYEYVPNKTLEFHLHGKDGGPPMDWPTRLKIALGSAKGLAYLHEDCHPKIIHRDIKAANILLEMNFEAKVADFGLAKFTVENNTHVSTRVMGTFGYLAPEYASSGKLSDKSDVFSFGVMLLELITGKRPIDTAQTYTDDSLVEWARPLLQKAMEDDEYDELIDTRLGNIYNPDEMARMVACAASCVRHSARRRPKMSQIVRALEGHVSLEALEEGIRPGHSTAYGSSYGNSEYDTMQYNEDLKKLKNIAFGGDFTSSEYSMPTSEYGQIQSASSGEAGETGKDRKNGHGS